MTITTARTDLRPVTTEYCPQCGDVVDESPALGRCCREGISDRLCARCESLQARREQSVAWMGYGRETAGVAV